MNKIGLIALVCIGSMGLIAPRAQADPWNEETSFTFNTPVEIPGQDLAAGTYVFKLVDAMSDRDVVQVFNANKTHLYGTFLALPDYRLKPTGKTIITFSERAAGSPEAVRAWFYPGDNFGHRFVYPRHKAAELARANREAVPSMPDELTANITGARTGEDSEATAMRQTPIKAQQPGGSEVDASQAFTLPSSQTGSRK